MIINLIPHPLRIYEIDTPERIPERIPDVLSAPVRIIYPARDNPVRLVQNSLGTQSLAIPVPVELVEYGYVNNLPSPIEGTRYIVPLVVALACKRDDLLAPYMEVRNDEGTVVGCRMLQQIC
jgi:hypothetical protein